MLKRDRLGSARVTLNPVVIFPAPLIQRRYQTSRAVSSLIPVFSHCLEKKRNYDNTKKCGTALCPVIPAVPPLRLNSDEPVEQK